jgi:hypothetical protein
MCSPDRPPTSRLSLGLGACALAAVALGVAATRLCATDLSGLRGAVVRTAQPPAPKVGAPAPAFTALDTRGGAHTLSAYRGQWVVLEWFNHDCPYTRKHYAAAGDRPGNTQAMQRDYTARGVVWLSVVSSAPGKEGFTTAAEADRLTRAKGAAPTAVIRDTAGVLGRLYGARNTPQYAIIDPQGVLRYAGAIDDTRTSKVEDIAAATNYVRAALDAGLAGRPVAVAQTQPYGCTVQY